MISIGWPRRACIVARLRPARPLSRRSEARRRAAAYRDLQAAQASRRSAAEPHQIRDASTQLGSNCPNHHPRSVAAGAFEKMLASPSPKAGAQTASGEPKVGHQPGRMTWVRVSHVHWPLQRGLRRPSCRRRRWRRWGHSEAPHGGTIRWRAGGQSGSPIRSVRVHVGSPPPPRTRASARALIVATRPLAQLADK